MIGLSAAGSDGTSAAQSEVGAAIGMLSDARSDIELLFSVFTNPEHTEQLFTFKTYREFEENYPDKEQQKAFLSRWSNYHPDIGSNSCTDNGMRKIVEFQGDHITAIQVVVPRGSGTTMWYTDDQHQAETQALKTEPNSLSTGRHSDGWVALYRQSFTGPSGINWDVVQKLHQLRVLTAVNSKITNEIECAKLPRGLTHLNLKDNGYLSIVDEDKVPVGVRVQYKDSTRKTCECVFCTGNWF